MSSFMTFPVDNVIKDDILWRGEQVAGCRTNNNPAWSTSGLADALQRRVRGLADDGVPPLAVAWEAVTKAAGDAWDAIGRATMGAQPSEPGPEPEPEKPEPDEPEARLHD